jgi:hypothetical protein
VKHAPKPNEELYGTWTNDQNSGDIYDPQKVLVTPDSYQGFSNISDAVPLFTWGLTTDKKWTDSEGNVWYQILGIGTGAYDGEKSQELYKLSKSGTVMERAFRSLGIDGQYDPSMYPTETDPKLATYGIPYREEQ